MTSQNDTTLERDLGPEAREFLMTAGYEFISHLNEIAAPNFLEFALVDADNKPLCFVSFQRPGAESPVEQRSRLKAENAALRRTLAQIARTALAECSGIDD